MIYYSIYDPSLVFGNQGFNNSTNVSLTDMNINGVMVQVSRSNNQELRVERIISTNPRDYLNPKLQPGSIVQNYHI